jgi:hypothetical protein
MDGGVEKIVGMERWDGLARRGAKSYKQLRRDNRYAMVMRTKNVV